MKLNAVGNLLRANRYKHANWQFASKVLQTDRCGFLITGSIGNGEHVDIWLAYSTSTGELEWETFFGDPVYNDYAQSLIQLEDGTYLLGGRGNGIPLYSIDESGNLLWQRSLVGRSIYGAEALIELENGGYLVAGFIEYINDLAYDAILLRTNAEGLVGEELK